MQDLKDGDTLSARVFLFNVSLTNNEALFFTIHALVWNMAYWVYRKFLSSIVYIQPWCDPPKICQCSLESYEKKHLTAHENVQKRATRLVPGLSSLIYEERLRGLQLPTNHTDDIVVTWLRSSRSLLGYMVRMWLQASFRYSGILKLWAIHTVSSKGTVTLTLGNLPLLMGSWINGIIYQNQWCKPR